MIFDCVFNSVKKVSTNKDTVKHCILQKQLNNIWKKKKDFVRDSWMNHPQTLDNVRVSMCVAETRTPESIWIIE